MMDIEKIASMVYCFFIKWDQVQMTYHPKHYTNQLLKNAGEGKYASGLKIIFGHQIYVTWNTFVLTIRVFDICCMSL